MSDTDGSRLKLWRTNKGLSQRELAGRLERSQGFVGNIEADKTGLSRDLIARMAERTTVNISWLLTGVGSMDRGETERSAEKLSGSSAVTSVEYANPLSGDFVVDGMEYSLIKRFEVTLSAGPGLTPVDGEEAKAVAVSRSWLLSHGLAADLCGLVLVKGDSMMPTIPDGSLVIVNQAEMSVVKEGIYAYSRDGEAFVKRLVPAGVGEDGRPETLVIISDNPSYPTETVSGQELNSVRVVGRVRSVLTDL